MRIIDWSSYVCSSDLHAFVAAVEAQTFFAVGMVIAKQRALPAAKGMPGHGHRNRHVDADHTDLDAAGKRPGNAAVTGEVGQAVAECVSKKGRTSVRGEVGRDGE